MRRFILILLLIMPIGPAMAQEYYYAQQTYPAPTNYPAPPSATHLYAGDPVYVPNTIAPATTGTAQQPAQQPNQPRPSDYGQSVMTDIRQMNF
jgi:hypothetical protein